ncbi:uncharacterized protein LOC105184607 [Harpegnathos saltator]|uniref:uncharacterized protein LOC105184607 n=1 Tax=Harpegnathos saltator TaxID=610380 RepID=UPI000DBED74F|nr:uncharacterized protein LOC105184607 [Harpegnathos saltator]
MGIPGVLKIRTARTGALLTEVPGLNAGLTADRLAEELDKLAAQKGPGYRVQRPVKTAALRLTGLDATVGAVDVMAAGLSLGAAHPRSTPDHRAKECKAVLAHCPVCAEAGRPAGHKIGGPACKPLADRQKRRREANLKRRQPGPGPEGKTAGVPPTPEKDDRRDLKASPRITGANVREEVTPASSPTRDEVRMEAEATTDRTMDPATPMEEEALPQREKRKWGALEATPPAATPEERPKEKEEKEAAPSPDRKDKVRRVEVLKTPPPSTVEGESEDAPSPASPVGVTPSYFREEGEAKVGTPQTVGSEEAPEEVTERNATMEAPQRETSNQTITTMAEAPAGETGVTSPSPGVSPVGVKEERPEEA